MPAKARRHEQAGLGLIDDRNDVGSQIDPSGPAPRELQRAHMGKQRAERRGIVRDLSGVDARLGQGLQCGIAAEARADAAGFRYRGRAASAASCADTPAGSVADG